MEKVPWTVMIKYPPTNAIFFITEIEADNEHDALLAVKESGYCVPSDIFELTAKQFVLFPKLIEDENL